MFPETIERLSELAKQGAVIVGDPPKNIATLSGGEKAEKKFHKAVKSLWGESGKNERIPGKGLVLSGISIDGAINKINLESDLSVETVHYGTEDDLLWLHRKIDEADWYFITVPNANDGFSGVLKFRATGIVELWDPVTGGNIRC